MPLFSVFMADVHEYVGIFYQVHPMGNVAIAGKAISRLAHLKRTAGGRLGFLQGDSLAIIWNFIAKLEAQALVVQLAKGLYDVKQEKAKLGRGVLKARPSTPPPSARQFQDHVMFTPQKRARPKVLGDE